MRKYSFKHILCLLLTCGVLSACSSTENGSIIGGIKSKIDDLTSPEEMKPIALPFDGEDYKLGIGDYLRITVYGQDEITGEYSVDSSGNIALPLVQDIPAKGLTIAKLKVRVENSLSPEFLSDPKISIEIIGYRDVYILGEVRNPGKYAYIPNMTVLQAVAVAGGHTYRAQEDWAEITRDSEDGLETFKAQTKYFVEPGDTIIVKRRWF